MRRTLLALATALPLVSCVQTELRPPPSDRFYYPVGIVHVDVPGAEEGTLYVASGNADRCYDTGALRAVSLDALPTPLPPLGAPVPATGPVQLGDLGADDPSLQVKIGTFAAELGVWTRPDGSHMLVAPTRAEGGLLALVDASGPDATQLSCVPAAPAEAPHDCTVNGLVLEDVPEDSEEADFPRAPAPFGVGIAPDGTAFVTHTAFADSPRQSPLTMPDREVRSYVVRLDLESPELASESYLRVNSGGTQSVAIGTRYAFVTARSSFRAANAVFAIPLDPAETRIHSFPIQLQLATPSMRGIAISADQTRLYMVSRSVDETSSSGNTDALLVMEVSGATTNDPTVRLIRHVPLPALPSGIELVERSGSTPLLFITLQGSGSLAIYDDAIGQLVTEVLGIGLRPTQLAVDRREGQDESGAAVEQARIFVSNFGDGRIAVVDVPDLRRPEDARVVAHLGRRQDDVNSKQSKTCRIGVE